MSSNRQRRRRSSSSRGELRSGIDVGDTTECWGLFPEDDHAQSRRRAMDRKVRMLCAQVERALSFAMNCEVPQLSDLFQVESVAPYPDAGRLLVLVRQVSCTDAPTSEPEQTLRDSKGQLRTCVANYINRKRAPQLVFVVIGTEEVELS
jgi:hypothetical protein